MGGKVRQDGENAYGFFPDYKDYNDVIITLITEDGNRNYVVSRIHNHFASGDSKSDAKTEGGVHFQSLSFQAEKKSSLTLNGARSHIGAEGSVTLIDYNNELYKRFAEHVKYVKEKNCNPGIRLKIEIFCYTGHEIYNGYVHEYSYEFGSGSPTINMNWKGMPIPTQASAQDKTLGEYRSISKWYKDAFTPIYDKIKEDKIQCIPWEFRFTENGKSHAINADKDTDKLENYLQFVNKRQVEEKNKNATANKDASKKKKGSKKEDKKKNDNVKTEDKDGKENVETNASNSSTESSSTTASDDATSYDDEGYYHYAIFDLSKQNSSGNKLLDTYLWFAANAVTKKTHPVTIKKEDSKTANANTANNTNNSESKDNKSGNTADNKENASNKTTEDMPYTLKGALITEDDSSNFTDDPKPPPPPFFRFTINDEESNRCNTAKSDICKELIFVQNGKFAPYTRHIGAGRTVIPTVDFNFTVNNNNLFLMSDILQSVNKTAIISTAPADAQISDESKEYIAMLEQDNSKTDAKNSNTEVSFSCYNIMSFELNNPEAYVLFEVYDAYGNRHGVSGSGTVTEVSYELSGAVIKANVKATKVFSTSAPSYKDGTESVLADNSTFAEYDKDKKTKEEQREKDFEERKKKYFELLEKYVEDIPPENKNSKDKEKKDQKRKMTKDDLTAEEQSTYISCMERLTNQNAKDIKDEEAKVNASYSMATKSQLAAQEAEEKKLAEQGAKNSNKTKKKDDTSKAEQTITVEESEKIVANPK